MMVANKSNAIDLQKHCYYVSKAMQLACKNVAFAGIKRNSNTQCALEFYDIVRLQPLLLWRYCALKRLRQ